MLRTHRGAKKHLIHSADEKSSPGKEKSVVHKPELKKAETPNLWGFAYRWLQCCPGAGRLLIFNSSIILFCEHGCGLCCPTYYWVIMIYFDVLNPGMMTLIQLEYIVALDTFRHFTLAADYCHVTQPTLSMQVQKLEEELGMMIFDRSKQPVVPTAVGSEVIRVARNILAQRDELQELIEFKKGILTGELRIGIIPTLAPYLLPLFIQQFAQQHARVKLVISEMTTDRIVYSLKEGTIDAGILVTPLQQRELREQVLFYEEMLVYVSRKNALYHKTYVLAKEIDPNKLWLLEEGHCFRSQIENLCELRKQSQTGSHFDFESGSIETLRRMVDINDGITILPELATLNMPSKQLQLIRKFKNPVPVREVSMVVLRDFVKKRLTDALREAIVKSVPEKVRKNRGANIIAI